MSSSSDSNNPSEERGDAAASSSVEAASWASVGLHPQLVDICTSLGWPAPTGIQAQAIPVALRGEDVIGLAETGSGKTGAFALPIIHSLLNAERMPGTYALVLTPTRELALQIAEQFRALGTDVGLKVALVVGGTDMPEQARTLARKPHVLVATPGRLLDHLQQTRGFSLSKLKFLVMDEADRILNADFEEALNEILKAVPDSESRTSFLFSATMTTKVAKLQRASLRNPVRVEYSNKYATPDNLDQRYVFLPAQLLDCYLAYILNEFGARSAIVFVATCKEAQRLALMLGSMGFGVVALHGKLNQSKRFAALGKFKSKSKSILVATDVASRGLDIPTVDLVINAQLPVRSKDYVHRVGRTARAGRTGVAISMVTQYDVEIFQRIENLVGKKMKLYRTDEPSVMLLMDRVVEAQAVANAMLRESGVSGKRIRYVEDEDETPTRNQKKFKSDKSSKSGRGSKSSRGKRRPSSKGKRH
ncbi:DEAD box ATP-dependent RNA helicase [Thecamonas trahens ATCC 50062]|uniref:DEAD box ATP-dependent RNA helicase n=1 Tax=Thecamonas trahens ATCC 50062 TaxID=461836 RepID=A0A0L0DL57_THETB|nr:DEAD box ATP-dependent RNA helicase [Thecamonas trahens ATCC 50062]KNC52766.1 DEAD box ATP-dependent RNA helicase [Thecamonas trahens ATCC 50062]|eukprot:XP_013755078.1 DEAD box ATP-dependent RNA helicase [Thecamonas trahens ATCC 50062]